MRNLRIPQVFTLILYVWAVFSSEYIKKKMRLSQNRVEMASFVLFQIEVIWFFFKKEAYKLTFSIQTVFYWYKPFKRLFLQDYVQWPAGRTQFQPS